MGLADSCSVGSAARLSSDESRPDVCTTSGNCVHSLSLTVTSYLARLHEQQWGQLHWLFTSHCLLQCAAVDHVPEVSCRWCLHLVISQVMEGATFCCTVDILSYILLACKGDVPSYNHHKALKVCCLREYVIKHHRARQHDWHRRAAHMLPLLLLNTAQQLEQRMRGLPTVQSRYSPH